MGGGGAGKGGGEENDVGVGLGKRATRGVYPWKKARRSMGLIMDGCKTRAPTAQTQASPLRSHFHQLLVTGRSPTLDISSRSFSARHININLWALGGDNALCLLKFTPKWRHQDDSPFPHDIGKRLAGSISYYTPNSA